MAVYDKICTVNACIVVCDVWTWKRLDTPESWHLVCLISSKVILQTNHHKCFIFMARWGDLNIKEKDLWGTNCIFEEVAGLRMLNTLAILKFCRSKLAVKLVSIFYCSLWVLSIQIVLKGNSYNWRMIPSWSCRSIEGYRLIVNV